MQEKDIKKNIVLNDLEEVYPEIKIPHDSYPIEKKKEFLLNMDEKIRSVSNKISQVSLGILEDDKEYVIANSNGKYIKSRNCVTRYMCLVFAEDNDKKEKEFTDFAQAKGYEILEKDLERKFAESEQKKQELEELVEKETQEITTPEERIRATIKGGIPAILNSDIETEYDLKEKSMRGVDNSNTSKEVIEKIYHDNLLDNLIEYINNNQILNFNLSKLKIVSILQK